MRRELTNAEEMLWRSLRDRGIGAKIRRQCPIGPYIIDFACVAAKLVIEVDGPSHDELAQQTHDARRDAWLRQQGWRVLRIPNALVIGGGDLPIDRIREAIASARPSSDPR